MKKESFCTAGKTKAETNAAVSFTNICLKHLTTASLIQVGIYSCETSQAIGIW